MLMIGNKNVNIVNIAPTNCQNVTLGPVSVSMQMMAN